MAQSPLLKNAPIKLTNADHRRLDKTLDSILEAYAKKEVPLLSARGALAQIITAAAIANEAEVRAWLEPDQIARWKKEIARNA